MTGTVVNGLALYTAVDVVAPGLGSALDVLGIGVSDEVFTVWELSEEADTTGTLDDGGDLFSVDLAVLVASMSVVGFPDIPDNKASMSCLGQTLQRGIFWLKISSLIPSASTWALQTMQLAVAKDP